MKVSMFMSALKSISNLPCYSFNFKLVQRSTLLFPLIDQLQEIFVNELKNEICIIYYSYEFLQLNNIWMRYFTKGFDFW